MAEFQVFIHNESALAKSIAEKNKVTVTAMQNNSKWTARPPCYWTTMLQYLQVHTMSLLHYCEKRHTVVQTQITE